MTVQFGTEDMHKKKWLLRPSISRTRDQISEKDLIQKFRQNATLLLNPRPITKFDWLFIMQHHGVKTRLLDWTESPLTATYFAVNEEKNEDGAIWVLLPVELNKFANIKPDYEYYIPSFDDKLLENYSPESFESEHTSELLPVAAIAPRSTARMQSQLGVFTICHRDNTVIEEVGNGKHVLKYIIPYSSKKNIMKELKLLGISKFQLFPELQSIGEMLKGKK